MTKSNHPPVASISDVKQELFRRLKDGSIMSEMACLAALAVRHRQEALALGRALDADPSADRAAQFKELHEAHCRNLLDFAFRDPGWDAAVQAWEGT
jgi:hypothetical protein